MKKLKQYIITGMIFVIFTGFLSHFLYEWTGQNFIIGLLTPVNESVWEHMKLIFFPMLLYSLLMNFKFSEHYPCITPSLYFGIIFGTLLIPSFFYAYTGILGHNVFFLDIAIFILSIIIAFFTVYKLTLSCKINSFAFLLYCIICIFIVCFLLFTYNPPNGEIFTE